MKEKLNHALSRVTLRQLRALTALVRTGSTKGAAAALHVTPPAITLQLRELESVVGLPLIERRPDGIMPTAAGAGMLDAALHIDARLADTADLIQTLRGVDGGKVAVGVISTAKYFVPQAIAAFAKQHANVDIGLKIGNREETIRSLQEFDLDLAIMGRPPDGFPVDKTPIGDHPHVMIAPPDHPLAGRTGLRLKDLSNEKFLLREPGSGTRILFQKIIEDAGFYPHLGMEMGSNETIKQAVIAGLGIAVISGHTIGAEVDDGRLAILDIEPLPVMRTWFLVKRSDKKLLPAAEAIWTFLATNSQDFLPRMPG
jgi:LysR family transcriptional regulator for metE and metH